ncbi:hypothetical protein ANN_06611 [Periplaneta americana]|uniref:Uncharacterized protein n=1 Tax=Periplaneta americana TaxID=6978 RepID=A0ABQ8TFS1_PERAM|nr:hypothetical protein ANN_06611 [Periplaneta americana]
MDFTSKCAAQHNSIQCPRSVSVNSVVQGVMSTTSCSVPSAENKQLGQLLDKNEDEEEANRKQDDSPPTTHRVHLPTKAPTVRYVPHSGWSRYKSAVQTLIPVRRSQSADQCLPLDKVGLFSYITFNWLLSTVNNLEDSTIPENSPLDSCDINGQR